MQHVGKLECPYLNDPSCRRRVVKQMDGYNIIRRNYRWKTSLRLCEERQIVEHAVEVRMKCFG